VAVADLSPVDLVVSGCVAVGEDGARLGKGGGFADLEFALATSAGLIAPDTPVVTTVHELQVRPAGTVPTGPHDAPVDFVVTPDRVIDCRAARAGRPTGGLRWAELTEEKIAAIPCWAVSARTGTDAPWPGGAGSVSSVTYTVRSASSAEPARRGRLGA
jgi:5-formyltetrahydrofolate cyclo-ligase